MRLALVAEDQPTYCYIFFFSATSRSVFVLASKASRHRSITLIHLFENTAALFKLTLRICPTLQLLFPLPIAS